MTVEDGGKMWLGWYFPQKWSTFSFMSLNTNLTTPLSNENNFLVIARKYLLFGSRGREGGKLLYLGKKKMDADGKFFTSLKKA